MRFFWRMLVKYQLKTQFLFWVSARLWILQKYFAASTQCIPNISYFRSSRSQMFFQLFRYLLCLLYLCNDLVNFVFNTFSVILKYFDIFSIIPDTVGKVFKYTLSPNWIYFLGKPFSLIFLQYIFIGEESQVLVLHFRLEPTSWVQRTASQITCFPF